MEKIEVMDAAGATLVARPLGHDFCLTKGRFEVECIGADGQVKWRDHINNLVTTVGGNLMADTILAGSAFTATVRMGLKGVGSPSTGDTQASHSGWAEVGLANAPTYSGDRKTPSFGAASNKTKSTSSAVQFSITGSGTVAGCFLNINGSATKDTTSGTLFSAGDFAGGNRTVASSDTLNVSYTLTV